MLGALLRACLCLAIGEALNGAGLVPVTGSVIGLCLFALSLIATGRVGDDVVRRTDAVMPHYGLLYVPAGVGLGALLPEIEPRLLPMLAGILVGSVITVAATAMVAGYLVRQREPRTPGLNALAALAKR